jgi:hypothetical protein
MRRFERTKKVLASLAWITFVFFHVITIFLYVTMGLPEYLWFCSVEGMHLCSLHPMSCPIEGGEEIVPTQPFTASELAAVEAGGGLDPHSFGILHTVIVLAIIIYIGKKVYTRHVRS